MNEKASKYIQAVVQYGSITKAADQLFVTPSALSRYITGLEKDNGDVSDFRLVHKT